MDDYSRHWDKNFGTRAWGRYPPEDLVRFMGRHFRTADKSAVRVLEVGCGPGANLWFMHREGFAVHGIDVAPAAIDIAGKRLARENHGIPSPPPDLRVGNFSRLPWADAYFDVAVDIFALYANTSSVIRQALTELARVLKPGGLFYSKLWGTESTGFGQGRQLETGTFDDIPEGPCRQMGVSHFFTREEIDAVFGNFFSVTAIDRVVRSDVGANQQIEEFHCQFTRMPD
jgi:ubiquinone/menaquinone biosynthesis C-methylase UbiE